MGDNNSEKRTKRRKTNSSNIGSVLPDYEQDVCDNNSSAASISPTEEKDEEKDEEQQTQGEISFNKKKDNVNDDEKLVSSSSSTRSIKDNTDGGSTATSATKEVKNKYPRSNNAYDSIKYTVVSNDGQPSSLIKLIGLKNLFAKQLPKMPKEYIARLVFDRRHKSLAILSDDPSVAGSDEEIIGKIFFVLFISCCFPDIVHVDRWYLLQTIRRNAFCRNRFLCRKCYSASQGIWHKVNEFVEEACYFRGY